MNSFGAGYLVGTAAATSANPNPTPRKFGQLQEVSVDDSFDTKMLYGANSRPLRAFRGQAKTEIKAKFAKINGDTFNDIYYSGTSSTGATLFAFNELHAVPAGTPWQVTIAPASSGTFAKDLGVEYATTGNPLKLVASAPAQGQYAVNTSTGVYTFATADASANVLISYSYTVATGTTIAVPNLVQQEAPYFEVILVNPQDGGYGKRFFKCSASKLNLQFKQQDIVIPELDISVLDPGTGVFFADYYATA